MLAPFLGPIVLPVSKTQSPEQRGVRETSSYNRATYLSNGTEQLLIF
jgi:hypothetical protein